VVDGDDGKHILEGTHVTALASIILNSRRQTFYFDIVVDTKLGDSNQLRTDRSVVRLQCSRQYVPKATFFTARRYATAVYIVILCLSVRLCVCQTSRYCVKNH